MQLYNFNDLSFDACYEIKFTQGLIIISLLPWYFEVNNITVYYKLFPRGNRKKTVIQLFWYRSYQNNNSCKNLPLS